MYNSKIMFVERTAYAIKMLVETRQMPKHLTKEEEMTALIVLQDHYDEILEIRRCLGMSGLTMKLEWMVKLHLRMVSDD